MTQQETKRNIFVFIHWQGMPEPILMGILYSELLRGKEVFSFEYSAEWLHSEHSQLIDPELELYSGLHYLKDNKPNFGLFLDSSPDRWGRVLMKRREAALARSEGRRLQNLFETDYLLGVFDGHRMGALRFKLELNGPFLNDNNEMATPPWSSIRELAEVSLKLEEDDITNDPEYLNWLSLLIAPGSSLGGARPKASIVDSDQQLWIAKFPSKNDDSDIGGWEMVTYELAKQAKINISDCRAQKFSSKYHTFLTKRFDRTAKGERIHFASAMTMLGFNDGQVGASYLDIVDFLTNFGANATADLEELWRRIVFSICVSNTDDHLRNHGFILTENGWVLSPAYDINPVENGNGLSLNISESDNSLDLGLALEVKAFFRLSDDQAEKIIEEVKGAVNNWRAVAKKYKISSSEQELKSMAFSRAE